MPIASARNCIKPQKENTAYQNKNKKTTPKTKQKTFKTKNQPETPHQIKMYQNKTFKNETQIQEVTQKWSLRDLKKYRILKPT